MSEEKTLKEKIIESMMVDSKGALEKNFEIASKLIGITQEGKVDIKDKTMLTGLEKVQLYYIGKLYAKEAGRSDSAGVTNNELMTELSLPEGSVYPWVKTLRDQGILKVDGRNSHVIVPNRIEPILKMIVVKTSKNIK